MSVRGKSTRGLRKVFVILSTEVVVGLQHLLMIRMQAGIHPTNIFLFARTTESPQDGCEAMRVVTAACPDLEHPDRIRTTRLRKYLATTTQVMDMTGDELKLLADHMGHSVAIHTDIYRIQTSVLERTKVARALVALEAGNMAQFRGRSMSSIDIDELPEPDELEEPEEVISELMEEHRDVYQEPESNTDTLQMGKRKRGSACQKRRRWTDEEENCLRKAFTWQINKRLNVSATDIREAMKTYPILNGRTEAMIRTKINNTILGKSAIK